MTTRWIASVAVSLGLVATAARAGDDPWRAPTAPPSAPAARIGRPVAADDAPALPPVQDGQVRRTGFEPVPAADPLLRAQAADPGIARPLPLGTPAPGGNLHAWKPADDPTPAPGGSPAGKPVAADAETLGPPRVDPPSYLSQVWAHLTNPLGCDPNGGPACGGAPCGGAPCGNWGGGCCYDTGNRWYVSADYLAWWMRGNKMPPLVTTGSAADAVPGALGQPGTQILVGGNNFATGADSGARFMAGFWLTRDHCLGFEGGYWFLGSKTNNYSLSSQGDPLLFRPFINETGAADVELVAVPSPSGPGLVGTVSVNARTSLWGTEGNFRSTLCCGPNWRIDGIAGFRAMGLDDDLNIHESLLTARGVTIPSRGVTVPEGTTFEVNDHFRTENRFYGGQIGLDGEYRWDKWIFGLKTKVALGSTNQLIQIDGSTVITVPGASPAAFNGGLLAQPSNSGRFSRDAFTVVPELGVTVGYQFNEHWRAFVGYNLIYWSSVVRSGDQIDLVVNRTQLPPPTGTADRPAVLFRSTDFWAQGVNFGIEFKW
jgi:hypothetical protein